MSATLTAPLPPMANAGHLVTGKELLSHPEWGPCELIRGKVVPVCRPNSTHGRLVTRLAYKIEGFVEQNALGMVFSGDSGIYIEHDPDTVRGPDIHFVRAERCPDREAMDDFLEIAPDLCIEIVSPHDQWTKLEAKIFQYQSIGVKLIWLIDPETRTARIYRLDGTSARVAPNESLLGESVLPGFEPPLSDLFSALELNRKK